MPHFSKPGPGSRPAAPPPDRFSGEFVAPAGPPRPRGASGYGGAKLPVPAGPAVAAPRSPAGTGSIPGAEPKG
ncbi:MAG: hypothetical protein ABUL68_01205, partial [Pseudomonadota bacterium]